MNAIFWMTLRSMRGSMLGWGSMMLLMGLMMMGVYSSMGDNVNRFIELAEAYPPEMMAFFGNIEQIATPEGFLSLEYFSIMPVLLGIFALLMGSGLIAADEEKGTLDLIQAQPLSRSALFWGRLLALVASTGVIFLAGWLGLLLPLLWTEVDLSPLAILLPFVSLFAVISIFAALGLLLAAWLPSRKLAASCTAASLVFSFFITGFARIQTSLQPLADWSPLSYFQSGEAANGLRFDWLLGLMIPAVLFVLLAWGSYLRRDIRVVGEGRMVWRFWRRRAG